MLYQNNTYKESKILREWYRKNERDLPWRHTKDPYLIWISEIILQQTRVAQGLDYYMRFVARFPDVRSLAEAEQQDVLKCWQGLGYYSRARNLHEAAKDIMSRYHGIFPGQYKEILTLKGIGDYTAAAIASFVWNRPYPVVDGNVYRVLGRLYAVTAPIDTGEGKKKYLELATLLMPPDQAGMHNQAMMEFGALQCVPQNPDCKQCPLSDSCLGYASGNPQQYPVKQNKTKTRDRYLNYFFTVYDSHTYLRRRAGKDIWEGLYEFPMIETAASMDFLELKDEKTFNRLFRGTGEPAISVVTNDVKHVLSHQILHATFYRVEIQKENAALKKYLKIPLSALDEYPFPRLIDSFLTEKLERYFDPKTDA
ncbi:MAG: A/G-specific adenine glycosylase [Tannerella sp.]|jgi:A/G-specific adenine glycosylase|nr:A/G-specific adenine glycosylase [Tannerella sp.]